MSNKIKSLVEELKAELEKETGCKAEIYIYFHKSKNENLDFSKANKIGDLLSLELGGGKKIKSDGEDTVWIRNNESGIANFSVFTSKSKAVAE